MSEDTAKMAEADDPTPKTGLPLRQRQPRQQLTKGMEHMRDYVIIPDAPPATPPSTDNTDDTGSDTYGVPASYQPLRHPTSAPTVDNPQKRSNPFQFGTRYLADGDDIFSHNAWDHVEVDPQYSTFIDQQTTFQRENQVSEFDKQRFNTKPEKWWDKFYSNNAANFFKDRKWLVQEFPILGEVTKKDHGPCTILEVGAGAGNTAFPILAMNENPELRLRACDYSSKAIELIRSQEAYTTQSQSVLQADVWDAAGQSLPPGLEAGTVDVVLMVFIFSALSPEQWEHAVRNVHSLLKPGGVVLFRDYGRGDLAQVRFKKGRYLEENFYVRGDGTRVYFFKEDELRKIWEGRRLEHEVQNDAEAAGDGDTEDDCATFEIMDLAVDRRMLVNRQRKLKMYRCWMQGRFRKPSSKAQAGDAANNDGG
jgi:tRNAThr (cytosine32-N3)-methyltransferase